MAHGNTLVTLLSSTNESPVLSLPPVDRYSSGGTRSIRAAPTMGLCGLTQTRLIYSARRLTIAFQTENLAVQYSARSFPKASAVGIVDIVQLQRNSRYQHFRRGGHAGSDVITENHFSKAKPFVAVDPNKLRQVARSMNTLILAWSIFFLQRCEGLNKPTHLELQHFRESAVRP